MRTISLKYLTTDDLTEYLDGWQIDSLANETIKERLSRSLEKFQRTLEYLPSASGRVLEIGAVPFFLSSVLYRRGKFDLELVDFSIPPVGESFTIFDQRIVDGNNVEEIKFSATAFDIEAERFPYDNEEFDGVIMCDVLQRLTRDPVAVLAEVHRLLKDGGWLLITTPNASYYGNLLKVWMARNIYSAYSNRSSIDRDNRQYTIPEFRDLFDDVKGLVIDRLQGLQVSSDRGSDWRLRFVRSIIRLVKRKGLNEEYIFCTAHKKGEFYPVRSSWLYQNYALYYPPTLEPLERSALVLPRSPLRPSRFPRRICKLCDELDWHGEDWLGFLDEMGETYQPGVIQRKAWEWAQGLYALEKLGLIREDATALAVGAGTEQVLFYLANHIRMVTATDIYGRGSFVGKTASANMLTTPERFSNIPFRKDHLTAIYMDGTALDFTDNQFDFAFSFSSIEHFGGHEAAALAVREMGRVTKPGGAVVITTEVVLNGVPHREFFRPKELQRYLVEGNTLDLLEDIDFSISDQTLAHPVDISHPDAHAIVPHVICWHDGAFWTSVCLTLLKPA